MRIVLRSVRVRMLASMRSTNIAYTYNCCCVRGRRRRQAGSLARYVHMHHIKHHYIQLRINKRNGSKERTAICMYIARHTTRTRAQLTISLGILPVRIRTACVLYLRRPCTP